MKTSLNFSWKYVPDFKEEYLEKLPDTALEVNIPHTAFEVPYNYFSENDYQAIVTYEKTFNISKVNKNRRYFIRFDGLMVKAHVYFNGVDLGSHISAYLPFEVEVTDYIKEKDNRLLAIVDTHEDPEVPPFGYVVDYLTFSGIYREVYLIEEPKTYLRNIYAHGDSKGNLDILYDVVGDDKATISHKIIKDNKVIKEADTDKFKVENVDLWDIDNPNLYTLETTIEVNGDKEVYQTRFGFRDVLFTNHGFYLNGKKIKLVGLNRHQGYPIMGYAASKSLQIDDADLLKKEVGVNVVRTSHYPQSEHFLNRCDEIGLLVLNEIPGWQHLSHSETWRANCVENARRMVLKERSHPSLIAHGVRVDESVDDHELYTQTNEVAHKLDPYRQTIGVRNFKDSELLEDIYGYNDFSCDSMKIGLIDPKNVKHMDKPYLVTEYLGHMNPIKPTSDEQKRIEVALRHAKVIDDNYKHEDACGAIGWCFVDYHTHTDFGSGDHICPHGVYDLYRNPKYSSYIYASQQDETQVLMLLSNLKPGDVPEAIFNDLYVATNCDYIELYKNDELFDKFYPKRDVFKYLKHPPILLDDIVGLTFKEDKFPEKHQRKIAKMFSYAAMHGFNHLPLKVKLYLGYMMMKYKISYTDLVGYWNEYVGSWGGYAKTYKIKGYKDNKVVKEMEIGPSNEFDLRVTANKTELVNEDTYDTLKVRVEHIDQHGSLMNYSAHILEIETKGPIELIGPSHQALLGGQLSLYIKSKKEKGTGVITIKMDKLIKTISVPVN